MFAVLLSDKMDPFYQNISSFPTAIFTFFLLLFMLFWLVAVLGFVEIDALDLPDIDLDTDHATPDAISGLIMKFGLHGVPITITLSILSLLGWFISYYAIYFFGGLLGDGLIRFGYGLMVFISTLYVAAKLTSIIIRPLKPLFKKMEQSTEKLVLGQTAVVRTSRVDNSFGEAILEDGGAGLILKVRSTNDDTFKKNDRVVLLEYVEDQNAYRVISEKEFTQ
mgnify:CR=1 FL=1